MVWRKFEMNLVWLLFEKKRMGVVVGFLMERLNSDDVVDDFRVMVVGMLGV
jgi:hypothetical protein